MIEQPQRQSTGDLPTGFHSLVNQKNGGTIRHCAFQAYACVGCSSNDDFVFNVVAVLDKIPGAVSLQSANYPDMYIGPANTAGAGRIGHLKPGVSVANVSFKVVSPNGIRGRADGWESGVGKRVCVFVWLCLCWRACVCACVCALFLCGLGFWRGRSLIQVHYE